MLSADQARAIANQWRPRFADEASFDQSWLRFFDMVGDPTAEKLHTWLAKDQAKDEIKHAGIVREPVLPTQQSPTVIARFEAALEREATIPRDCWQCGRLEHEPAAESCASPRWHLPNANLPQPTPPRGWHHLGSTLA